MSGEYQTYNCPECERRGKSADTEKHLYVYGEDRGWFCFRCGYFGNRGLPGGVELDDANFGDEYRPPAFPKDSVQYHLRHARCASGYKRALQYLDGRGLDEDQVVKSRVLYAITGRYAERVIFPIYDDRGIHYFVARTVSKSAKPPYLNAPVPKNGYVYPVGKFPADVAVVVEGVFDAYAVASIGVSAIAILGKSVTQEQAKTIGRMARAAIVVLDEDAFAKSLEVAYRLSFFCPTRRVDLPAGRDPDRILSEEGPVNLGYWINSELSELQKEMTGVSDEAIKRFTPVARTGKRSSLVRAIGGASELPSVPAVQESDDPIHEAFGPDE